MSQIVNINTRIDSIKTQMKFLSEDKNVDESDRIELKKYYEKRLQELTKIQDKLAKNIEVDADILDSD